MSNRVREFQWVVGFAQTGYSEFVLEHVSVVADAGHDKIPSMVMPE
jgi:hypothetical protein